MKDAIAALISSRKALVLLAAVVGMTVAVVLGKITQEQYMKFLEITVPAWMASHAFEESFSSKGPS